jgi:serine protease inhibitor
MKLWIPMLLAATAALGAAQKGHNPPPAQQQSAATESYVSFGISLFEQLAAADPDGNVIVSPVSAGLALSMVANGAEGGSLASMLAALGGAPDVAALNRGNQALMEAMRSDDLELAVANSLWARAGVPFLPSYLNATRDSYAARVEALDFDDPAAAARINAWVSENTRGRITEMVEPPLPGDLVLYLANAVYFKGDWKDQFLTAATRERTFHAPSGPRQHPLMHRTGSFRYLQGDGFSAARLPYEGDRFAMYLLLPDSGQSLADLRAKLDAANWERWMGELRPRVLELALPRFTLETSAGLVSPLSALGMGEIFDPTRARLDPMVETAWLAGRRLHVSDARQKVFIQVDEEGTEAAAVTGISISVTSVPPPPTPFVVDRPFLFAIRDDQTGALLFLGQVTEVGGS